MAPTRPRLSRISWLFLLTAATTQAASLVPRQASTCGGDSNLQQCGTGFPSDFCCPKNTACISLNTSKVQSVICCPSGSDCAFIQTITCDIKQLNATQHPDNQLHLSDTTGIELPKCGDKCCPLGYNCSGGMCSKNAPSASSTSASRALPTSTAPASASQTSSCPSLAAPAQSDPPFDGRSFAAGFFPGIVIGALGTIGLIWVIKKRRETQSRARYSGDFGHVSRQISDPIYDPQHAARTDFIRRGSASAQPSPNSMTGMVHGNPKASPPATANTAGASGLTPRIKSMWDRTPKLSFGFATGLPAHPAPAVRAGTSTADPYTTPKHTPRRIPSNPKSASTSQRSSHRSSPKNTRGQPPRSDSTETIDVLMPAPSFLEPPRPPAMRERRMTSDSGNTTFTKLMERAGYDEEGRKEVREFRRGK